MLFFVLRFILHKELWWHRPWDRSLPLVFPKIFHVLNLFIFYFRQSSHFLYLLCEAVQSSAASRPIIFAGHEIMQFFNAQLYTMQVANCTGDGVEILNLFNSLNARPVNLKLK